MEIMEINLPIEAGPGVEILALRHVRPGRNVAEVS